MEIKNILSLLDKWRCLPDYQLERRADIFFAYYMPDILRDRIGQYDILIPEFPIRKGLLENSTSHQSVKIDYMAYNSHTKQVLYVELKTDNNSMRESQQNYLQKTQELSFKQVIQGIIDIYHKSSAKSKYQYLLEMLSDYGLVTREQLGRSNTYVVNNIDIDRCEVVYIAPKSILECSCITFEEIAQKLEYIYKDNETALSFAQYLRKWQQSPKDELNANKK